MRDFVGRTCKTVNVWRRGRVVEGTSLLRTHTGLNLYRGFESLRLRQNIKAPQGAFVFLRRRAMPLRASREGFEGLRLQAQPRPAGCRRIPPSPPKYEKPLIQGLFYFRPATIKLGAAVPERCPAMPRPRRRETVSCCYRKISRTMQTSPFLHCRQIDDGCARVPRGRDH